MFVAIQRNVFIWVCMSSYIVLQYTEIQNFDRTVYQVIIDLSIIHLVIIIDLSIMHFIECTLTTLRLVIT